jgi:hypothetical protein
VLAALVGRCVGVRAGEAVCGGVAVLPCCTAVVLTATEPGISRATPTRTAGPATARGTEAGAAARAPNPEAYPATAISLNISLGIRPILPVMAADLPSEHSLSDRS